ncbi:predicted protein [Naegleria gruberi]|uniref:Predicted protein n=1 Tax=Naegleria gruberi TaxID=5762 RepID=D2V623_NAEGR|nr:uncharacterized protein NAEGRDRAFT_46962 [Naegleria gruberi]EFC47754.1 predicted protein [Naegleria gruberi]|eukprot:XP_002680498.1 predicted protein [Naegleria gruberi strain NEG-M]
MPNEESQEIFHNNSTHKEMTLHPTMSCSTSSSSSSSAKIHNPPSKIEKRRGRPPKITSPLSYPVRWQFMKEEGDVHVSKKQSNRNRYHNDISIVNCYDMFKEGASPRTESPSCSSSTSSLAQTNSPSSISQQTRTSFQLTESSNMLIGSHPLPPPTATMLNNFTKSNSAPSSSQYSPMNDTTANTNLPNYNNNINNYNTSSSRACQYPEQPSPESYFLNNAPKQQPPFNSSLPQQSSPLVIPSYPMPNTNNNSHYFPPYCTIPPPQQQQQQNIQNINQFPTPIQTSQFSTPKKQVSHSPKSTPSPSASVYHSWKVDLSPSTSPYQKHGELSFSLNDTIQVNSNNYKVSMTSKKPSPSSSATTHSCNKISPPKFTNQITTTSTVMNQFSTSSPQNNTISTTITNTAEKILSPATATAATSSSTSFVIHDNYVEEIPSVAATTVGVNSSTTSDQSTTNISSSSPHQKTRRSSMPSLKDILN